MKVSDNEQRVVVSHSLDTDNNTSIIRMSTSTTACSLLYSGQIRPFENVSTISKSKLQVVLLAASIILGANACKRDTTPTRVLPDFSNTCCGKFVKDIETGKLPQCVPRCTQCKKDENETVISVDVCLNEKAKHYSILVKDLDCFKLEAAGIKNCTSNRNRVECGRCKEYLKKRCNIDNTTPCKVQRNKRDDADSNRNVKTEQDHTSSYKTMKAKEEGRIGSETTLQSAFFSLTNAIQASKTKELEGTDTRIAMESVVQIVECIIAAITLAGSLALMYKMRKRFNRIVHRCIPKSRFPPKMEEGGASNIQNPEALIQAVVSRIEQHQASQPSRPPQPEYRQPLSHLTAPAAGATNF